MIIVIERPTISACRCSAELCCPEDCRGKEVDPHDHQDARAKVQEVAAADGQYMVGVAKVDVTPGYPIRLNGFGNRREESEGITQRIWAKALAIGADEEQPVVLITVDSLGIRMPMADEVAARLAKKAGIERARVAIAFSHSHTTPKVVGACDTISAARFRRSIRRISISTRAS